MSKRSQCRENISSCLYITLKLEEHTNTKLLNAMQILCLQDYVWYWFGKLESCYHETINRTKMK